jgi:hypothetical protein
MSKDEQAIEAEIQTKGLTAKRITPEMIDDEIAGQDFHVFPASCLTVCCLTLKNGYTVTGESACASPENFDVVIGCKIARANAREKIWPLLGFRLRDELMSVNKKGGQEHDLIAATKSLGLPSRAGNKRLAQKVDNETFTRMWLAGVNTREMAEHFGYAHPSAISHRRELLGLPPRERSNGGKNNGGWVQTISLAQFAEMELARKMQGDQG